MAQKRVQGTYSAAAESGQPDERAEPRDDALRAADILLGEGRPTIACLVKDRSESGFRLIADTPLKLPDHFDLVLSHPMERYTCKLVWRKGGELGVQIT